MKAGISPSEQLKNVITKAPGYTAFLPYLQPFSNTYGSIDRLKAAYEPLLEIDGVVGLAIGTRPDCFSDGIFDYLKDLSARTYLSIEIGLQSANNDVLARNNRGHTYEDFTSTVKRLGDYGIETVAHVMLGLQGDTHNTMIETADKLARLPVSGVKVHQLMIIRGTECEKWHNNGTIHPFALDEYTVVLCEFLQHLHPRQHIHRIVADSRLDLGLVAPLWSAQKAAALSYIHAYMDKYAVMQGSAFCIEEQKAGDYK